MSWFHNDRTKMVSREAALPGRLTPLPLHNQHAVLEAPLQLNPLPDHLHIALFGMGCFWGAEKLFWNQAGVYSTAVGYAGGFTPNPTYAEVCTGLTGHNEVVRILFDPSRIDYPTLLALFWRSHNPTEGMAQGNDHGTQYRSGIYPTDARQLQQAKHSLAYYQAQIQRTQSLQITTEIVPDVDFYFAENEHQQYLAKHPHGYCPNHTCQVSGLPSLSADELR